jgi:diguanylate cyclase (GGDEF)-like protein/PAS domain S-box-containing protein
MTTASLTRILVVEDNGGDARLFREMLSEQSPRSMRVEHVDRLAYAEKYLAESDVDAIVLDLGLPDAEGLDAVRRTRAAAPHVPLVILTGLDDEELAIQALQQGAQDYLIKGQIETRSLQRALRHAVERKLMEEALFVAKERAQVTLDSIGDAVISTDVSGGITYVNGVAEKLTGWGWREAAGRPLSDVFLLVEGSSHEPIPTPPGAPLGQKNDSLIRARNQILVRRDGVEMSVEESVAEIHDRSGAVTGSVVVFRDVSAARAMSLQMAHSAQHDALTGLPNRILLNDRIQQAIAFAQRHSEGAALLFLDLDGFKHVNDSLGHSVGDRLLQSVARRLVNCGRASDTISRQGGDEFVVLLTEVQHAADAGIVARRMLQAVAEPHSIDQRDLYISTSIGVSLYPHDGADPETLIKNADIAMYQAKAIGGRNCRYFEPTMDVRAVERQSIEENLRRALGGHEFTLHYQPKVDFKTGMITGAEALLRWTHPDGGVVSPAQFIPVAEECGLIVAIGNWVLREACQQARAWLDAGLPVMSMAVNVSAIEFRQEAFVEGVFAILHETGLDPTLLELELTESALMKNSESASIVLQTLRKIGIHVAIDDFGTGDSSLSYLREFPVDTLKIDPSFASQINTGGDVGSIVTAVINMARSLRLRVVAEGVETAEQHHFLRERDCDEAQGFYFSRPVPANEFADLLKAGIPQLPRAPRDAFSGRPPGPGL